MRSASTIVQHLLEADAFDIKQDLLREQLCPLCGLPLLFTRAEPTPTAPDPFDDGDDDVGEGWPFGRDEPKPEPTPEPDEHDRCRALVYWPENNWRTVNSANGDIAAVFKKVVESPRRSMYHDSRFWDGEARAVLYTRPDQWRTLHDVQRASFFARKHSEILSGRESSLIAGFEELARHLDVKGVRLHETYVLELGILLTRLGADSYTILKPYMAIAT